MIETDTDGEEVLLDRAGRRATVTLHRPAALNAITPRMLQLLGDILEELADDETIDAIVITGAGRAFSAGVDLKALGDRPVQGGSVGDILDLPARRVTELLTTCRQVVIAAVNGHCFTGALELALACDLILVNEDAKIGDTHAKFGLRPTWGMSQRLARAVGPTRARWMTYTGRAISGTAAVTNGLAAACAPSAEFPHLVDVTVEAILANSSDALTAAKTLYREQQDLGLADGLLHEAASAFAISDTDERLDGFR